MIKCSISQTSHCTFPSIPVHDSGRSRSPMHMNHFFTIHRAQMMAWYVISFACVTLNLTLPMSQQTRTGIDVCTTSSAIHLRRWSLGEMGDKQCTIPLRFGVVQFDSWVSVAAILSQFDHQSPERTFVTFEDTILLQRTI